MGPILKISFECPEWVNELDWATPRQTDEAKMALAVDIARKNITARTGGPFGSAIFDPQGQLVSVGMNMVMANSNSTLHGEIVAFVMAHSQMRSHKLAGLELFTSCEPCAMCLGATLWSGVGRIITAATGEDARAIGFDEGPVFPESWRYIEERGIRTTRNVMRAEAKKVLDDYLAFGGPIYNSVGKT